MRISKWWSKITTFFVFPLSSKIISFYFFCKASIICNQYILWVCLRQNSIFKPFQCFTFPTSLNNWPIKSQVFVKKKRKMHRLTVNLNIWVKPNELRQDHWWKRWCWSKIIYPFYENILIKRWKIWNFYLNFCLSKIVVLLSNHENHLQTIFLPENIAYLLSYFLHQHFYTSLFIAIFAFFPFQIKLFSVFYTKDQLYYYAV